MMVQESSSSPRHHRRMVVTGGIVGAAALIGICCWALAPRPDPVSRAGGQRLSIAVVAPVEPELVPGGILEVGTLNDGFNRAALDRRGEVSSTEYSPPEAYVGDDWPPLDPPLDIRPPIQTQPESVVTVTTTDPLADGSRLFGFDRRRIETTQGQPDPSNPAMQSQPVKETETFFE